MVKQNGILFYGSSVVESTQKPPSGGFCVDSKQANCFACVVVEDVNEMAMSRVRRGREHLVELNGINVDLVIRDHNTHYTVSL